MSMYAEATLTFMHELMDIADTISHKYFKQNYTQSKKSDTTPVTQADVEIEQAIRSSIGNHYPTHAILGEEFGASEGNSAYTWVIDPIDGTKAFIRGEPTFTTLIGLLKDGAPYAGMVSQPIIRKRWCAVSSAPITRVIPAKAGIQRAESSAQKDMRSPHLPPEIPAFAGMTKSGMQSETLKIATTSWDYLSTAQQSDLLTWEDEGADIAYTGDAYAYMQLAEGKLDAVFDVSLKPYDILPLLPILQNAGVWHGFFDENGFTDKPTGNIIASKSNQATEKLKEILF